MQVLQYLRGCFARPLTAFAAGLVLLVVVLLCAVVSRPVSALLRAAVLCIWQWVVTLWQVLQSLVVLVLLLVSYVRMPRLVVVVAL